MNNQLLKLTYIRKRERKSLFLVILVLLFSSFSDEIYLSIAEKVAVDDEVNSPVVQTQQDEVARPNHNNVEAPVLQNAEVQNSQNFEHKSTKRIQNQAIIQELKPKKLIAAIDSSKSAIKSLDMSVPILEKINIDVNDPNVDQLVAVGIPKKVAYTWSKYTKAGGKIYSKEDLSKVYGMDEVMVEKVAEHIVFPKKMKINREATLSSIYVNQATAYELSKIPGIGPVLSERIVKFRDNLGGFHSVDQIKEVYGIEEEVVEKYKRWLLIQKEVEKININTCDEKQLGRHLYCSYRVAKAIVNYRNMHGNFTGKEDLMKLRVVDEVWVNKISAYLEY